MSRQSAIKVSPARPASDVGRGAVPAGGRWAGGAHLVILPTEGCNLRCIYCYQGHTPATMSRETRAAVKRLIARLVHEEGAPWLHLEWYGGEPLAAWPVLEEISSYGRGVADEAGIGFSMSMTTNGTLLDPERFARLAELGCTDYQITLDGPGPEHDLRRVTASGRGSFARVWRALLTMKASRAQFRTVVRLGFDRGNREAIRRWIPELAREFAGDDRFEFYGRQISYPGHGELECSAAEGRRFAAELAAELGAAGLRVVDMRRESRPGGLGCYAGRPNAVMIGADGTLHKCAVNLDAPGNTVGRLGEDGSLQLDLPVWRSWVTADMPCRVAARAGAGAAATGGPAAENACPVGPEAACPVGPQLACPVGPQLPCPVAPDLACPVGPEAACPVGPETACPVGPEAACPVWPQLACPVGRETACPVAPAEGRV